MIVFPDAKSLPGTSVHLAEPVKESNWIPVNRQLPARDDSGKSATAAPGMTQ